MGAAAHPHAGASGAVYVFERDAGGTDNWGETQEIIPSDPGDTFGTPAIDGSTIIASDTSDNPLGSDSGAAYIFEAPGGPLVTAVTIDIKPDGEPNSISLKGKGVIPVAILTTDDFNAFVEIRPEDAAGILFFPAGADPGVAPAHNPAGHVGDVDGDGDLDVLVHYRTQDSGIGASDEEACISGVVGSDEIEIEGCDSIRIAPGSNKGGRP